LSVHPVVANAARGDLPDWADASKKRRAHMGRVAALLSSWAEEVAPADVDRWRAAGWLHDALRDAPKDELRALVPSEFHDWPGALLHGPASAARLRADGVTDGPLLAAVAYHTVGHPALEQVGHALYMADYLEPGRAYTPGWRALMRARMPGSFTEVLREVAATRIEHLLHKGSVIRAETSEFWNSLVRS
jgi:HD superfamily phosphohydrolase YqeK